jgi:AraC-like DNA-binding protein/ligand-binding sensor protein
VPLSAEIIRQLSKSEMYRDYEEAFNDATHLPLALRPHELWHHALQGKKYENPFCALMASSSRSCAACLEVQDAATKNVPGETTSVTCFAGLCDTAVPVTVGNKVVGFLQTGQIALREPTDLGFTRVAQQLMRWGAKVDLTKLQDAYFHSKVLSREQYQAMVRLLEIFAKHLSAVANQILVQKQNEEPPVISRAKQFIGEHQAESISLDQIAKALNVSTFYFCKMFKKATGLTFTHYLARARIERAKKFLLNPNIRISEVAYDCGFISLTHFNRIFKRIVGKSPTEYRQGLKTTLVEKRSRRGRAPALS